MSNLTSNAINQSEFVTATYTIQQLLDMPSTLNGEQSPLDPKRIAKLEDNLLDNELRQPLEVTLFNGSPILTGGRNRTDVLSRLYALTDTVVCLQYVAKTADDVFARVTTSNGGRTMKQGEVKLLEVASKFGFGLVSVESLMAAIDDVRVIVPGTADTVNLAETTAERIELFITALAISLDDVYSMGDTTALVVARSLMTPLKKVKATLHHDAKMDTDGVVLCKATVEKYLFVNSVLTMGTDATTELLETLVNSIGDIATRLYSLPAKAYLDAYALNMGMVSDVEPTIVDGTVTYVTTIKRPTALQRNSARFVKVAIKPIISFISEALEVELN